MAFLDRCVWLATSGGTGSFVEAGAIAGYQSMEAALAAQGVSGDQSVLQYAAQTADLSQWEYGLGTWTVATKTLTRSPSGNSLGTTAAINFVVPPQVLITAASYGIREKLTFFPVTYYVRNDGNDSNSGLTNTAGGAFLTINHAVDVVVGLDLNSQQAVIQLATGTYNEDVVLHPVTGAAGATFGGGAVIRGDTTTPANVVLNSAVCIECQGNGWQAEGVRFVASDIACYVSAATVTMNIGAVEFAAAGNYHVLNDAGSSVVNFYANYSITGGASQTHWLIAQNGTLNCRSHTVTLTGTPAFAVFAKAISGSALLSDAITFTGSATGTRYDVESNAVIDTRGGGANYFPGNAAGVTSTGGQYV